MTGFDDVERCVNRRKRLAEILTITSYGFVIWLGSLLAIFFELERIVAYFIGVAFCAIAFFVGGIIYMEIYDEFGTTLVCETKLFRRHRRDEDEDEINE